MKLILALVLTLGVGAVAGYITMSEVTSWYPTIQKPSWTPPNWLFAPVWTVLYVLMAIAFWMVWKKPVTERRNAAVFIYLLQLTFNFLWSIIFFWLHQLGWASVEIVMLWILIVATFFTFRKISRTASWLLLPYLAWVSFATALTISIWRMNGSL
jgi:benzodiazapine receptor